MTADRPWGVNLPEGITLNLVRWHCARCGKTSTWTGDDQDPLGQATAEAWGHDADHQQWAAERAAKRDQQEDKDA